MGRLFWKFFFAFFGALMTAGVGVGIGVHAFYQAPSAQQAGHHPPPPPGEVWPGGRPAGPPPGWDHPPPHVPPPDDGPPGGGPPPPLLPIIAAILVSLVASALLAWYFAKPVRHLRWAFGAVADGRLDIRVQPLMAGRRDEIADLGGDFDAMTGKLRQLIESQRRLLHDVSHELRSPLARVQAAIGLARQDPARVEATLDRIEREATRLDHLVGELLAISRLDAGAGEKTRFDVIELIAGVADDARFEAQTSGRDLVMTAEGEFVVEGSVEALHRAFENVVRNAIRFAPLGTTVEVTVDRPAPGRLHLAICDRGPGVLPSELEAIFEPFHRGAGASPDGFGLGLAIARRAVSAHGGSIRATNRPPGGLCVEIELPAG